MNGSLFEYFITHAVTDRYNILCSLVAHDKKQLTYEYNEIIIGDRLMTEHVTTETLKALGVTLNFIEICLKLLDDNDDTRRLSYITDMKEIYKQISTTMTKLLSLKKTTETYDRNWWWMINGKNT